MWKPTGYSAEPTHQVHRFARKINIHSRKTKQRRKQERQEHQNKESKKTGLSRPDTSGELQKMENTKTTKSGFREGHHSSTVESLVSIDATVEYTRLFHFLSRAFRLCGAEMQHGIRKHKDTASSRTHICHIQLTTHTTYIPYHHSSREAPLRK